MTKRTKGDYEVGYGKTPKHTRWPPGVSGNPKGKEKGHKGLKSDLEAELNVIATVKGANGWNKKGRQQRLAIATLCVRAANGDLKAQALLFPMIMNILGVEDRGSGPKKLSKQDQAILDELLASQLGEDQADIEEHGDSDLEGLPPPPDASSNDDKDEEPGRD